MSLANLNLSFSAGGIQIQKPFSREGDGVIGHEVALPAGDTGQLTTRTDAETGTITMDDGHGITTGMIVDLYWDGGYRYGVTVGTVSSNSVPIGADDSGAGDDLPTNLTELVVTPQVTVNTFIDGDALKALAVCLETLESAGKGHVDMLDSGPASIEALSLVGNVPRIFDITGGDTNVFTGNPIVTLKASNGSSSQAATLKVAGVQDSTP